jgi:hypothetical protein
MENQLLIPPTPYTFTYFYENYVKIKDNDGIRKLNDNEIIQIKELQQKIDKGYEPKLIKLRCGSNKIIWVKSNNN